MIGQNDLVYNDDDSFEDEEPIRDGFSLLLLNKE